MTLANNMKLRLPKVVLAFIAIAWLSAASTGPVGPADPARYLDDIKALSAPAMEGRGAGTEGLTRARDLIVKRYKELKIQPEGSQGYLQPFTLITGARLKPDSRLIVSSGDKKKALKTNQDFVPFSFSSSGPAAGSVVFAGYGITADEYQYDDYANLDVKDKIVVLLRYEPTSFAGKSGNQGLTHHSQTITKAINARNHGARAVVMVNGKLGDGEEDLLTRFGSVSGPENIGIVFVQVKNAVADSWLQVAGKSLKELQNQINAAAKPASFELPDNLHLSLNIDIETTRATVNMAGRRLPATSPPSQSPELSGSRVSSGSGRARPSAPSRRCRFPEI